MWPCKSLEAIPNELTLEYFFLIMLPAAGATRADQWLSMVCFGFSYVCFCLFVWGCIHSMLYSPE